MFVIVEIYSLYFRIFFFHGFFYGFFCDGILFGENEMSHKKYNNIVIFRFHKYK